MKERVGRNDDEKLYQPKIHSDRIRELYTIGTETGIPLTVLVDFAIQSYIKEYYEEKKRKEIKAGVDMSLEDDYRANLDEHEFEDLDQWEDGSLFGF